MDTVSSVSDRSFSIGSQSREMILIDSPNWNHYFTSGKHRVFLGSHRQRYSTCHCLCWDLLPYFHKQDDLSVLVLILLGFGLRVKVAYWRSHRLHPSKNIMSLTHFVQVWGPQENIGGVPLTSFLEVPRAQLPIWGYTLVCSFPVSSIVLLIFFESK